MQDTEITNWPFPINDSRYGMPFNIRVLRPGQSILKRSSASAEQLQLKQELRTDKDNYFRSASGSEAAQNEVPEYLRRWSADFKIEVEEGPDALWRTGLQIQEDLILLEPAPPFRMIAGAVFFPSGWSVADKMGLPNEQIHAPVPGYQQYLHTKTEKLLAGLKYARPVARDNWGVRPTNKWNQLPMFEAQWQDAAAAITSENAGKKCFFRGEYQTLSRLKKSAAILFTIHSWQKPICELTAYERQQLAGVLRTCPDASLIYKGIQPFKKSLLAYLSNLPGNNLRQV